MTRSPTRPQLSWWIKWATMTRSLTSTPASTSLTTLAHGSWCCPRTCGMETCLKCLSNIGEFYFEFVLVRYVVVWMCVRAHTHMHAFTHARTHTRVYVCMHARMHARIHTCIHNSTVTAALVAEVKCNWLLSVTQKDLFEMFVKYGWVLLWMCINVCWLRLQRSYLYDNCCDRELMVLILWLIWIMVVLC